MRHIEEKELMFRIKKNRLIQYKRPDAPAITFMPPRSHWCPGDHILPCAWPYKLNVHALAITFMPGAGSCKTLHMPHHRSDFNFMFRPRTNLKSVSGSVCWSVCSSQHKFQTRNLCLNDQNHNCLIHFSSYIMHHARPKKWRRPQKGSWPQIWIWPQKWRQPLRMQKWRWPQEWGRPQKWRRPKKLRQPQKWRRPKKWRQPQKWRWPQKWRQNSATKYRLKSGPCDNWSSSVIRWNQAWRAGR